MTQVTMEWLRERCRAEGRLPGPSELYGAVMEGAVERVRPKMMTVVAIMAGLLPIMWSTGTGSEVMRRIAAPMVGGMVSDLARLHGMQEATRFSMWFVPPFDLGMT